MIGMVLAAGAGRRLRPLTDAIPKTLLPVDGETTILDIALRNLASVGLRQVVVVVGYRADSIEARREALEDRHGVELVLVHNDRAEEWNNCYSLWLARDHFGAGALLVNGDTVHPPDVERILLGAQSTDVVIAVDTVKHLREEEMKVSTDTDTDTVGSLREITKLMDPAAAYGEYIGATLIPAATGVELAVALEKRWRSQPDGYYEDGFQTYVDDGGRIALQPIGSLSWVEVDDHADLARAREIAQHY
jgi:choline kinase